METNELGLEEIKEIFSEIIGDVEAARIYIDKGDFRISSKGNLVCEYYSSRIVIDPTEKKILSGGELLGIHQKKHNNSNFIHQKTILDEIVSAPGFFGSLENNQYIEKIEVFFERNGCIICPSRKKDSPVELKSDIHVSRTVNSEQDLAIALNERGLISSLTQEKMQQILPRIERLSDEYLHEIRVQDDEAYIYEALTRKEWKAVTVLNNTKKKWGTSCEYQGGTKLTFIINHRGIRFNYDLKKDSLSIRSDSALLLNKVKAIRKQKRSYKKILHAIEACETKGQEFRKNIHLLDTQMGTTPSFSVSVEMYGTEFNSTVLCKKEATDKFKADIKKTSKDAEKAYKATQESQKKQLEKQGLYGSILVKAVCETTKANSEFITENIVCKILRGLKLNTERTYTMTDMAGKFNLIPEAEMKAVIRKMIHAGILKEWWVDGTYTDYYAIQPGSATSMECVMGAGTVHFGKDKQFPEYTDTDWLHYLSKTDPQTLKDSYWPKLIPVFDHPAPYCTNKELFVSFFGDAPEAFKEYIGIAAATEEGAKKKLMRDLSRGLKEKANKDKQPKEE